MNFREVHTEWKLALADHEARRAKRDATRKSVEGLMVEMADVARGRLSSLAENSPKALLKKARKIRDTAKELRARAARNIKRAKALERRARATPEVQPTTLIPWVCNGR